VRLVSDSRATDGAVRALADAASAARDLGSWRIIGGHMVNLHASRAGVALPSRATRDADLAVDLLTVRDGGLLRRLGALGYRNSASSNRFVRDAPGTTATIDILAPSYSTRHEANVDAGTIAVDGIPALHVALARPPVVLDLTAVLTDDTEVSTDVNLPDLPSAIAIKTFAYAERFAARDAEDLLRLVEAAHRSGLTAEDWPDQPTFAAAGRRLRTFFDSAGRALAAATTSKPHQVRLRALIRSLVGTSP
jgi:hypothetical protein